MFVSGGHCSSDGSADWCKLSCQLRRKSSYISVKIIPFTTRIKNMLDAEKYFEWLHRLKD